MSDTHVWMTASEAAPILRVGVRQVHRYAEQGRIVTKRAGRRVYFCSASVDMLAEILAVTMKPEPVQTARRGLIQPSELLDYLRERDQQLEATRERLGTALLEVGRLQAQLEASQAEVQRLRASTSETI